MKSTKLNQGAYRAESSAGTFIIRKLQNTASTDFQWGVFTEDGKLIESGYTKGDCENSIETWEQGTPIPPAENYDLQFPSFIGSKRVDPGTYRMDTPLGIFAIRKLPNRKRGEFQWGIFSEQGKALADHFTRADCESLIRDWVAHGVIPKAASKSGCLTCIAFLFSLMWLLFHLR